MHGFFMRTADFCFLIRAVKISMQSTKPYFLRALHEWCIDQGYTPYLAVVVDEMTRVPMEYVKNGEIVFNVGLEATNQLSIGNETITFQGRFSGKVFPVLVPIARVSAIYARENGEGMSFEVTASAPEASAEAEKSKEPIVAEEASRSSRSSTLSAVLKTTSNADAAALSKPDNAQSQQAQCGDTATRPTLTRIK